MKQYVFLFRGGLDFQKASPEQMQQAMQKWKIWLDNLQQEGKLASRGNRLQRSGTVVSGSKKELKDGPYAETKEVVGGFIAVNAANQEEAVEIAKGCPIFDFDGTVEVREVATM